MEENRNCSIDIFRLICAIMVVAIHTAPFMDQNEFLGYAFTEVLPRIAVPFFYITAGYFFIGKLQKGENCFIPALIKVFKLYLFWSAVYFIKNAAVFLTGGGITLQTAKNFVVGTVLGFIFYGTEYHLWYFIGLMVAMAITWAFYKLKLQKTGVVVSLLFFALGLLGESYYALGTKLPIVTRLVNLSVFTEIRRIFFMAFPFFAAGYVVRIIKERLSARNSLIIALALIPAFVLEIVVLNKFEIQRSIVITATLYPLTVFAFISLLKYPMATLRSLAAKSRSLANFTYYAHPLFIWAVGCLSQVLGVSLAGVVVMLAVIALCVLTWFILSKINSPIIKKYVL